MSVVFSCITNDILDHKHMQFCNVLVFFPQETTLYGATVKIHEPVGVIGIMCPDQCPLLSFVSLFAPAVVRGNAVVIVPSEKYPMLALDLYQVSDLTLKGTSHDN